VYEKSFFYNSGRSTFHIDKKTELIFLNRSFKELSFVVQQITWLYFGLLNQSGCVKIPFSVSSS
jgi:hypothetical protein